MTQLNDKNHQKIKKFLVIEFLAGKLENEQTLSKYFNSILNEKYLKTQRKLRCKELNEDLTDLLNSTKTIMRFKDSIIKSLKNQLVEHERLSEYTVANFLIVKDQMLEEFKLNIEYLKKNYENEVSIRKGSFDKEKSYICSNHYNLIEQLNTNILALEAKFIEEFQNEDTENRLKLEAMRNKNEDLMISLKINYENITDKLRSECKILNALQMQELKKPENLTGKNITLEKVIIKDSHQIEIISKNIDILNEKLSFYDSYFHLQNKKKIINEKFVQYNTLSNNLKKQLHFNHQILIKLSSESNAALLKLKSSLSKVTKILKWFEICAKLKDEQEYFIQSNAAEESNINKLDISFTNIFESDIKNLNHSLIKSAFIEEIRNNSKYNFSKQLCRIKLEIESLKQEQADLKKENQNLKYYYNLYSKNKFIN
jgi:hypothetical protein